MPSHSDEDGSVVVTGRVGLAAPKPGPHRFIDRGSESPRLPGWVPRCGTLGLGSGTIVAGSLTVLVPSALQSTDDFTAGPCDANVGNG